MVDVLLVDDSRTMRMLIMRAFRQAGLRSLTVEEASGGEEAVQKLQTVRPRLIISDWNMPGLTGLEFLRQARALSKATPFGFITSEASLEIRSLALSEGASFLITKPFNADQINSALSPILGGC